MVEFAVMRSRIIETKRLETMYKGAEEVMQESEAKFSRWAVRQGENGEPAEVMEINRDITDRIEAAEQLRRSRKIEAIGTLAGGIAHYFNNILTAIIGYGNLLQMNMEGSDPRKIYVNHIIASSQKAVQLTQSLLAFGGKQAIELKPVKINTIIWEAEDFLRGLLTEDIELTVTLAQSDATIRADAVQIDQILMNLVANARDAMPKGGKLTIKTESIYLGDQFSRANGFGGRGNYALISVSDTGVGMDQATRDKIFEPFFTTKEVGKGMGLGLSTVYGIVKQHNGYITVRSEPDKGATFVVCFPVIKAEVEKTEHASAKVKGGSETILVAEDNTEVRELARKVLESNGYNVLDASDGDDAVLQFMKHKDEIVLLLFDVVMPRKNGKEAYEEIRKVQPDVKILFTGGHTGEVVLIKGVRDKEINFIRKPLSPNELLIKVREVLDT